MFARSFSVERVPLFEVVGLEASEVAGNRVAVASIGEVRLLRDTDGQRLPTASAEPAARVWGSRIRGPPRTGRARWATTSRMCLEPAVVGAGVRPPSDREPTRMQSEEQDGQLAQPQGRGPRRPRGLRGKRWSRTARGLATSAPGPRGSDRAAGRASALVSCGAPPTAPVPTDHPGRPHRGRPPTCATSGRFGSALRRRARGSPRPAGDGPPHDATFPSDNQTSSLDERAWSQPERCHGGETSPRPGTRSCRLLRSCSGTISSRSRRNDVLVALN